MGLFSRPAPAETDTSKLDVAIANAEARISAGEAKIEKSLAEFRPWVTLLKWIAGGTVAAVIVAAASVDKYIEQKIATHVQESDELVFALGAANGGDWHAALGAITDVWRKLERSGRLRREFKQFLFGYMIWILSSNDRFDRTILNFEGSTEWSQITHDNDFGTFVHSSQWRNDPNVRRQIAICLMKFGDADAAAKQVGDNTAVQQAGDNLALARDYDIDRSGEIVLNKLPNQGPEPTKQVAMDDFLLALHQIVAGKLANAAKYLQLAAATDPNAFDLEDMSGKYRQSILNGPDFILWRRIALRWGVKDFDDQFSKALGIARGIPQSNQ